MKIGILGTGHIGKTLVKCLSKAGHDVKVANSRGPETIGLDVLANGGRAVTGEAAVEDVEVLIISVPFERIPGLKPLISKLSENAVLIDTSNYYPMRDGTIGPVEAGQVESQWVAQQLGRPIAKAWNAIGSDSFARLGSTPGNANRIAIPVAADRDHDRQVTLTLVDDSGFDAFDAGPLAESWRQQPGAPAYCTDLSLAEMPAALQAAERERLPKRRDLAMAAVAERMGEQGINPGADFLVRLNRALYM